MVGVRPYKEDMESEGRSGAGEEIVVVPVRRGRRGSRWQGSGFMTKRGDQILSYTSEEKVTYRKGGRSLLICVNDYICLYIGIVDM